MTEALEVLEKTFSKAGNIKLTTWPHYKIKQIQSMEDIRCVFPEMKADELNWFFCSTSGVHGSYATLDDIEKTWNITDGDSDNYYGRDLTVLIVQPRLVVIRYGHITIEKEDIPYLRKLVSTTLQSIKDSQKGNTESLSNTRPSDEKDVKLPKVETVE